MKALTILGGLTVLNLAWSATTRSAEAPLDAVGAEPGEPVAAELIPGVEPTQCTLLVFFDPGCPFCVTLADAHRKQGDPALPTVWVTDRPEAAGRFRHRLPEGVSLALSRSLFEELEVRGVPAGVWLQNGIVQKAQALNPSLGPAELAAGCDPVPPLATSPATAP